MFKVKYNLKTGAIEEWGENPSNSSDSEIIDVTDDELMPYLTTVCSIVDGQLIVDEIKLNKAKEMTAPQL